MKMIVGLGNPGKKYEHTKHNIGFFVIDALARAWNVHFKAMKVFEAEVAEVFVNGEKIILVKPQTFMNDSGRAVRPLMDYYRLTLEELVVLYDDMDLPVGQLRLRQKGSAGGHNGMKSLFAYLGTQQFNRIRVGVGRPFPQQTVVAHVLSDFAKDQQSVVADACQEAAQALSEWVAGKAFLDLMNQYNQKKTEK